MLQQLQYFNAWKSNDYNARFQRQQFYKSISSQYFFCFIVSSFSVYWTTTCNGVIPDSTGWVGAAWTQAPPSEFPGLDWCRVCCPRATKTGQTPLASGQEWLSTQNSVLVNTVLELHSLWFYTLLLRWFCTCMSKIYKTRDMAKEYTCNLRSVTRPEFKIYN